MRRSRCLVGALLLLCSVVAGCGDDGGDVGGDRADQVRRAAREAGLADDVSDVLALAATGATATFQVTYGGRDGAEILVSQDPPNRRVDALTAGLIVQSQVVRDGVGYTCELPEGGQPGDPLECDRTRGAIEPQGAFTAEALTAFTDELARSRDAIDLTVETRTIAGADATCLVAAPVAGTPLDGAEPSVDTICLSPEGAQLLLDSDGERVVATAYSTEVPDGTFDV